MTIALVSHDDKAVFGAQTVAASSLQPLLSPLSMPSPTTKDMLKMNIKNNNNGAEMT